jgi:Z1 domain/SWI2/SNF2 ATPase
MEKEFDLSRFEASTKPFGQYERQLRRLRNAKKEVICVEEAVRGAVENLRTDAGRSFVIYGEPQSGKTEMMICLTAKLLDEGHNFILHLLNDSVDLLGQNLGRFKSSGLSPAARNYTEIMDPAVKIKGQQHVVFCKKNGADLRKLYDKIGDLPEIVIIDDEADYASPNAKVNDGARTAINDWIYKLLKKDGVYVGVTATPARLDLNNTFDNDSEIWVNFPPHRNYTGQDVFFPLEGTPSYRRTLLPDSGSDPKHARQALFSFLVNVAYLNNCVNGLDNERNYSFLVHTSGKKADHRSDWNVIQDAFDVLLSRSGAQYRNYVQLIWGMCQERYADADPDELTQYVLDNAARRAIIVLNSERDWKDNSSAATQPNSPFTVIIGGNIVSRGVTLDNLLSMFFTRDVKHKIQQDTYIQRARMFGSRGDYLRFFELTIPESLYTDWHRCFLFHRLALAAIRESLGSLVWLTDRRIVAVAGSSIDRSTVDLDKGEMSFGLFAYNQTVANIIGGPEAGLDKIESLAVEIGDAAFPQYLRTYIKRASPDGSRSIALHEPIDMSGYRDADNERIYRQKGFIGATQVNRANNPNALHHLFVIHNGEGRAKLFYKFAGSIQFIRNTAHDPRV